MSWSKILLRDIKHGLLRIRYLFIPLLVLFPGIVFITGYTNKQRGTWMDFMLYIFRGKEPVPLSEIAERVEIPILWLLIMVGCLVINLDYPLKDISNEGLQILIRSKSRLNWFLSKCAWNICSSFLYLAFIMLSAACFVFITGNKLSLDITPEISNLIFDAVAWDGVFLTTSQAVQIAIYLPFLTIAAINMLQMSLCFVVKPIVSFLISVTIILLSTYLSFGAIIGNGAMAIRSIYISADGISTLTSALVAFVVIFLSILLGGIAFRYYNILKIGE